MRPGVAILTMAIAASSLALARRPAGAEPFPRLADVPHSDRDRRSPQEGAPSAAAAGKKLYDRHCASCHGAGGENGRRGPGLRSRTFQDASAGAMFWVITNGNVRSGMPVWSKLPEPQRWQIVEYLRSLGPRD
jgi:mono/diheme cytochrome c family protein